MNCWVLVWSQIGGVVFAVLAVIFALCTIGDFRWSDSNLSGWVGVVITFLCGWAAWAWLPSIPGFSLWT